MAKYIPKSALVAEIESLRRTTFTNFDEGVNATVQTLLEVVDTLEVKEVEEKAVNNDLEDYAKKESESFAEREYEIDYIDRNALAKGYYWGVKAGAQWQKEQDQPTIELAEDHAYFAGSENTRVKLIDKACEWLKDNWRKYVWFDGDNIIHFGLWENDFRKAMEE